MISFPSLQTHEMILIEDMGFSRDRQHRGIGADVKVFIQARMSSNRFPGKVLAPLNGYPIIIHVISQVLQEVPKRNIVVATSTEHSDDPLASYMREVGITVYRGPLDDVFQRFRLCLSEYPCEWFFRVCSDSPMFDAEILHHMIAERSRLDVDLFTNVFPRTYPKGQSVEMLNAKTFAGIDMNRLTEEEREHVTKFYYNHPDEFTIVNFRSEANDLASRNLAVDTVEDLHRMTASHEQKIKMKGISEKE